MIIDLFHDLKLNNSVWIATCFFFFLVCNYKHRFCFTLGKARVILFWRNLHFYIISRIGKKKKKKNSCFIELLSFPSVICCINLGFFNISFSFPKAYNLLICLFPDVAFWCGQADELQMKFTQKMYCPQRVFISDGDTSINIHFLSLADV